MQALSTMLGDLSKKTQEAQRLGSQPAPMQGQAQRTTQLSPVQQGGFAPPAQQGSHPSPTQGPVASTKQESPAPQLPSAAPLPPASSETPPADVPANPSTAPDLFESQNGINVPDTAGLKRPLEGEGIALDAG